MKDYMSQWSGNSKEKRSERWRNYKERRPDYKKEYHKNNPDKSRSHARRRRARVKSAEVVPYTEQQVIDTYGICCHLCGDEIDLKASRKQGLGDWEYGLHIDHLIPISSSGADSLENVRPAHVICNLRKGKYV